MKQDHANQPSKKGSRFVTRRDGTRVANSAYIPPRAKPRDKTVVTSARCIVKEKKPSPAASLRTASPALDRMPDDIKFDLIYMITVTRMARYDGGSEWRGSSDDKELFVANAKHFTATEEYDYGQVYDELVERGMVNTPAV